METAAIGVIGGSGFYEFLEDPHLQDVETPYGPASAPLALGEVAGRSVAFLPRHGPGHEYPPHLINYRANLWALRSAGVRQVLAPCAAGALRGDIGAGRLAVPDQLVDRTTGRNQTYVERGAVHATFADPYCPVLRDALLQAAPDALPSATMVVIDGPRFSTRAESRWYADQGWRLVNMTGHPEAVLARELGMCFATLALVTDVDAGASEGEAVEQARVFELFAQNLERLRTLLADAISTLSPPGTCACHRWLAEVDLTYEIPAPA